MNIIQTWSILKTLHLTGWVARLAQCKSLKPPPPPSKKKTGQLKHASVWKKKKERILGNSTLFTGAATWPSAPKSPKQPISVCFQRVHWAVSSPPRGALTAEPFKVYQLNALPYRRCPTGVLRWVITFPPADEPAARCVWFMSAELGTAPGFFYRTGCQLPAQHLLVFNPRRQESHWDGEVFKWW